MSIDGYQQQKFDEMVESLSKPGQEIIDEMTPVKAHLMHMVMGVSGEAGELLDAVKKHVMYGKELDIENVIEEMGDIEFYLSGIRNLLNMTRQQCLIANAAKLSTRYPKGTFDNEDAQFRADKQSKEPSEYD